MKRKVELVILSDVHLGTYGAHAKELVNYLQSIKPKTLVLNGDIIDIWQFRKRYFPKSHLQVIKKIISLAAKGTKVYYITGNHDEKLRKFSPVELGNISVIDKLVLNLDGKKAWIFHGDVFDASIQHTKWIAKLGGWGYDFLIVLNSFINWCLVSLGRPKYSLSKKIKNSVKKAISFITDFEETAAELAIENKFDYVICGHIHQPQMRKVENANGSCLYLNSGDWIENLTALEYHKKTWSLMEYEKQNLPISKDDESVNTEIDPIALMASIKMFS
ncbi:UDP-2,3-diacylglucosamine diphosphatase [Leeuwenhoekiella marinoflava]|uniref:UDP-2,3-diacylglucosamine pyrophosphatase LpxH n=2 Tax=Leeuwenhoekiella marinoflava TaxID=988 RepID=A0A4Q0PM33_9FLAO|nr:UDP-2,3-diacylglucosamine diphosphatase [Leeuwenhoekiella marinoflava]RXG28399.1 UDP-2,3-diacylglucosamine pyrophosphatase LpxH [Leeuwenhoekiella marinoflava]SHF50892.1 UDP-2,3-diacylglucosamine pyrophosphatase LpxH [Leeuwenhoekiella marinoflava DSM 3653]